MNTIFITEAEFRAIFKEILQDALNKISINNNEQKHYTVKEAAKYLKIHPQTIYKHIRLGNLKKLNGCLRTILISEEALLNWLKNGI
jgi:excisionase family DNA binding protein